MRACTYPTSSPGNSSTSRETPVLPAGYSWLQKRQNDPFHFINLAKTKEDTMINLTPHAITVRAADGTDTTFPPSGTVARVSTTDVVVGTCPVTGAPIVRRVFGDVTGLPADGT